MNDNEITFWMKSMFSHKALTLEETKKKTDGKEVVLNECLKEYWLNKVNANGYKEIVPFDAYADFIIPKEETNLLKKEKARLNVQGWNKFLISILQHFFPQFFFRKDKSNVKLRFLKELNDDYLWGFEYDKNWLTKNRLGGGLGTLEDFNLILMHKDFDKRNKNNDYIYNPLSLEDENILSLGIMGNPVFFRPAFELSTFELRSYRKYRQVRHSINNEDDSVSVQHDQSQGEQIKQYLYFYIHVLSYTAQPYLEYLEKCILNKLNN